MKKEKKMGHPKVCIICNDNIGVDVNGWDGGHNASPIKEGQCCENCNRTKVIPERMRNFGYSEDQIKELSHLVT